ncbi:IS200/IS605 family transposase, partial [Caldibacillus thermoamylovorans]|nr:IS200/IS605 family transposase [Caldibacillus thermoamylovorans]
MFCPKYRRKVLVGDIEEDLKEILYEVAKENDVEIKALEIMPDHVHMFISFDPRQHIH